MIENISEIYKKDNNARVFAQLFNVYYLAVKLFFSFFMKLYCKLYGIELGERCSFYGRTTMVRKRYSNIKIGKNCRFRSFTTSNLIGINHRCIFATHALHSKIIIGDGCGFSGTVIGAFSKITLGKNVRCGANTLITDSDWHLNDPRVGESKPIIIHDNVWLGYGAIVMKGVTIGENTVIGAGSIVTKSIPANVIAAGNPCKVIKQL
jgi:acetyltransferase-like isoleucine patch superfamily enzyme